MSPDVEGLNLTPSAIQNVPRDWIVQTPWFSVLCDTKLNDEEEPLPRWMRVVRGMIGTGLTFATGVGAVTALVGVAAMVFGEVSFVNVLRGVGKMSVATFLVGVGFSGVLALVARGRTFEKLTLGFVTALGAGAGFLYFLFIAAMNGARVWTPRVALLNFGLLLGIGSVSAAATFLLARRAGRALRASESMGSLGEGHAASSAVESADYVEVDR